MVVAAKQNKVEGNGKGRAKSDQQPGECSGEAVNFHKQRLWAMMQTRKQICTFFKRKTKSPGASENPLSVEVTEASVRVARTEINLPNWFVRHEPWHSHTSKS